MQIDQPQADIGQRIVRQHHHCPVEAQLGLVDVPGVSVQFVGIDPRRLDFLDNPARRIPAIDATADCKLAEGCGHPVFAPIALVAILLIRLLSGDAFLGEGCRLVAIVQIPSPVDELGEFLDAYPHATPRR